MIKAVLFDYGGVLTEAGKAGGIQRVLGELYGVDAATIAIDDLHQEFVRGLITEAQFFAVLNERYGKHITVDQEIFEAQNEGFFQKSEPVYELAAQLRAAGLRTGILSNIYPMSALELHQRGFYDDFSPLILSCEEHLAKPEPNIFKLALKRLDLPGDEVLFIDDHDAFRPVVEALGMHFITALSAAQIVEDTRALLLKENNLNLE